MILTKDEKEFLGRFEKGDYIPELLFEDEKTVARIKNHPMAMWKTRRKKLLFGSNLRRQPKITPNSL